MKDGQNNKLDNESWSSGVIVGLSDGQSGEIVRAPFSVQERDIDLLILERLHTEPDFVAQLATKLNIDGAIFHDARHSVYRGNGETDVLLFLDTPSGRIAVMLEDKIGAVMQPQQCERYHTRGQTLCDLGEVIRYTTVLCAPRAYLASVAASERWDHRLAHEEVAEWMENDLSPSGSWRRSILQGSIAKLTRARQADSKANTQVNGALAKLKDD